MSGEDWSWRGTFTAQTGKCIILTPSSFHLPLPVTSLSRTFGQAQPQAMRATSPCRRATLDKRAAVDHWSDPLLWKVAFSATLTSRTLLGWTTLTMIWASLCQRQVAPPIGVSNQRCSLHRRITTTHLATVLVMCTAEVVFLIVCTVGHRMSWRITTHSLAFVLGKFAFFMWIYLIHYFNFQWHWQVLPCCLSCLFSLFQSHVLGHLSAHQVFTSI